MYKRFLYWVIAILIVGFLSYLFIPKFLTPTGVWYRRVVRKNPLQNPIQVTNPSLDEIVLSNGTRCKLAGVKFPDAPLLREGVLGFLQVATQQGVEIIRRVDNDDKYILRCEPRI